MLPADATPFVGKNGEDVAVTFDKPGIYGVKCLPHYGMGMVALVVVGTPANIGRGQGGYASRQGEAGVRRAVRASSRRKTAAEVGSEEARHESASRSYQGSPLFSAGFRPFFLLGSLYAGLAILVWLPVFTGELTLVSAFAPRDWHVHEMLYGYLPAVITGFLFTAIPNWTGRLPLRGTPLDAARRRSGSRAASVSRFRPGPAGLPRC